MTSITLDSPETIDQESAITFAKIVIREALDPELKFVDEDVTVHLHRVGLTYLANYAGSFDYLRDLQTRNPDRLSIGQIRGVLNCIRAEVLREGQSKLSDESLPVSSGRYAIYIGDKLRFFHVNSPAEGKWAGYIFIKEFVGGGEEFSIRNREARNQILGAIANDPDALARYGQELGICGICGRELTDEVSRATGIGPVCRNK